VHQTTLGLLELSQLVNVLLEGRHALQPAQVRFRFGLWTHPASSQLSSRRLSIGPAMSATMAIKLIERNAHVCFKAHYKNDDNLEGIRKRKQEAIWQSTFSLNHLIRTSQQVLAQTSNGSERQFGSCRWPGESVPTRLNTLDERRPR
jgi:hypothetical protein